MVEIVRKRKSKLYFYLQKNHYLTQISNEVVKIHKNLLFIINMMVFL